VKEDSVNGDQCSAIAKFADEMGGPEFFEKGRDGHDKFSKEV
jgi:hypothetical protein